jgi:hypothetical protein
VPRRPININSVQAKAKCTQQACPKVNDSENTFEFYEKAKYGKNCGSLK